jgi:cytochrome c556
MLLTFLMASSEFMAFAKSSEGESEAGQPVVWQKAATFKKKLP